MVNKIIAWIVVAVAIIIWRFGYGYIDGLEEQSAMMGALAMFLITGYMMGRMDVPEGDMMTTIMDSMKGFLMNIVWLTFAVVVMDVAMGLIKGGAFDPMNIVNAAIFSVVAVATSALVFSSLNAAMKD
jgi:hypothetical protein